MEVTWFDEDRRTVLDWMQAQALIDPGRLLACGWCIIGHLAFRAAQEPEIKATACFYATGLHSDTLGGAHGSSQPCEREEIRGSLLLVWERAIHIPQGDVSRSTAPSMTRA
jgi:carboxymethylenebutenolidase